MIFLRGMTKTSFGGMPEISLYAGKTLVRVEDTRCSVWDASPCPNKKTSITGVFCLHLLCDNFYDMFGVFSTVNIETEKLCFISF